MQDSMFVIDETRLLEKMWKNSDSLWYNENSRLRMDVVSVLLSNRLGKNIDFGLLAENLGNIFDGATVSENLILAAAEYENGDYSSCIARCREMQAAGIPDEYAHRLLFIKADALMTYANEVDDRQTRTELLDEAEKEMKKIQTAVEDDYIECLRKLSDIYGSMGGRQDNKIRIDIILEAFPLKNGA